MSVEQIITDVVLREGAAYTDRPTDSGGPTKYGITLRTLSAYRGRPVTAADVQVLTEAEARAIYRKRYITDPGFGAVLEVSPAIGEELIDTGVNCGVARAAEFLQRSLNALNRNGRDFPDVRVDGDAGPATIAALRAYLQRRGAQGERVLLRALNSLQGAFYIELAERRPKDEDYVYGWLANRVAAP